MPSLLITGGAGFIGSNLVRHALVHTSEEVVVVDKITYAANPHSIEGWTKEPRVTFVQGDIANRALMEAVVEQHHPRAILNLAAETHVDRSIDSPQAFLDTNVIGTFTLLEVARRGLFSKRRGPAPPRWWRSPAAIRARSHRQSRTTSVFCTCPPTKSTGRLVHMGCSARRHPMRPIRHTPPARRPRTTWSGRTS